MEQYNYQQPKKNNGLVIGLSIAVALLLIALVGVLAYNFGKDKGNDKEAPAAVEKTVAPADTVAQSAQPAPAQQATTAAAVPSIEKTEPAITNARSMEYLHLVGTIAGKNVVMDLSNQRLNGRQRQALPLGVQHQERRRVGIPRGTTHQRWQAHRQLHQLTRKHLPRKPQGEAITPHHPHRNKTDDSHTTTSHPSRF